MIVDALAQLAFYYQSLNDKVNAVKCFQKAEKICESVQDKDLSLKLMIDIGGAYYQFLEYHHAIEYLSAAFKLALEVQDHHRQLMIINNLSTIYAGINRFDDAETIIKQGIGIAAEHNVTLSRIMLLFGLGVVYMRQDLFELALQTFGECSALADSAGFTDPKFQMEIFSNLAGCYRYKGQLEAALDFINRAELIAIRMQNPQLQNEIAMNKANLLLQLDRHGEAKKLIIAAKKFFSRNHLHEQVLVAQMNLADYYEQTGDLTAAIKALKEIHAIYGAYMAETINARTKESDQRFKDLMQRYDQVRQDCSVVTGEARERVTHDFVGQSAGHKKVLQLALMAAKHPSASVLITGESGTGKEIVANLIHLNSIRKAGQFVAVNVSAISPGLIESEFFGHKKGAFTGAIRDSAGFFVQANRGTLYLDEIGDMPVELQAKLLRALETRRVTPVGSGTSIEFDCRIISSTNRDLVGMMKKNQFRLDLYHRLNTIEIDIPPLRSRPEDVEMIIRYYLSYFARQQSLPVPNVSRGFIEAFRSYSFPGNTRELRNLIERLFILNPGKDWDENDISWLQADLRPNTKLFELTDTVTGKLERDAILEALQKTGGKQKDAARILGLSESTLTRRIVKHGLGIYTRKGK